MIRHVRLVTYEKTGCQLILPPGTIKTRDIRLEYYKEVPQVVLRDTWLPVRVRFFIFALLQTEVVASLEVDTSDQRGEALNLQFNCLTDEALERVEATFIKYGLVLDYQIPRPEPPQTTAKRSKTGPWNPLNLFIRERF